MENDLIKLVEDFVEAVENGDQKTLDLIASESFEFREKYFGRKYNELLRKPRVEVFINRIHKLWLETEPYVYIRNKKAAIVYETRSGWHFSETKFQSGFVRHSFYFTKQENWKLKTIKKEFLRFSKYNTKESLNGFVVWSMAQVFGIKKWI